MASFTHQEKLAIRRYLKAARTDLQNDAAYFWEKRSKWPTATEAFETARTQYKQKGSNNLMNFCNTDRGSYAPLKLFH